MTKNTKCQTSTIDIVSEIIALAKENNFTIGTVESCTAGLLVSTLTDVEGASAVIKNSFVTYSNEAKIEAGVSAKAIKDYGVYSTQTAEEMAQVALNHRNTIGIGITGTLGNTDPNNEDSTPMTFSYCIRCQHVIPFTKTDTIPNNIVGRKAQKEYVCNTILKSLLTRMKEVIKCKNTN